jgi:hypothetical protein
MIMSEEAGNIRTKTRHGLLFGYPVPVPIIYTFTPQPDITSYELALCVPIMQFGTAHENRVLELPESVRRHFVKEG